MFQKSKLCASLMLAFSGGVALTSLPALAQQAGETTERIEVTGSRIKRADAEGSLPVTVVTREQLEASGAVTVAEFVRNSTFASAGNFRPQSGSSAQSFAGMDLRGLGTSRTLVLIDGRRLPKAPNVGDSVDMNSIPMAAVERIEILTDGASAVYGSDAIGGVVNVITRKDFEGVALMLGEHMPETDGGDRHEFSAVMGLNTDKGRLVAGVARTKRDMVFTRQRPWGQELGVSSYGNNYFSRTPGVGYTAIPDGCTEENFWLTESGQCSYNFNAVAADEAQVENTSLFARGEYRFNDDWSVYLNSSVSRVSSFGRYAPSLAQFDMAAGGPNDFIGDGDPIRIRHRFAALGTRDNNTETNLYDVLLGVQGRLFDVADVDFGMRRTESKYDEKGKNYVVIPIALQFIADGTYDLFNPSSNDPDVLSAMKATITRDGVFKQSEVYASATFDVFKLGGGTAQLLVAADHRKEVFADIYDSLSEAGVIGGSSGNSAAGDRKVTSAAVELVLPIMKGLEVDLAGRFEDYSDYGNDFAPKASIAWRPMSGLTLRASAGTGFRAPPLNILHQKTQYSAESVFDYPTCRAFGGTDAYCQTNSVQVDTYYQANPELKSEKSTQFSLGGAFDVTNWMTVKADYFNIKIKDTISQISATDILNRDQGTDPLPIPPGLGLIRDPGTGAIERINAGYANEGELKTDGIDLEFAVNHKLGGFASFRHNLQYSHIFSYKQNSSSLLGLQGLPRNRAVLANTMSMGDFDFTWNANYIGKNGSLQYDEDGELARDDRTPAYVTHDFQVNWDTPIKGGKLTVGVINAFGRQPNLIDYDGRNFNFYLYDSYGATPYVRYTQKL